MAFPIPLKGRYNESMIGQVLRLINIQAN